jgi:hypothetical protein
MWLLTVLILRFVHLVHKIFQDISVQPNQDRSRAAADHAKSFGGLKTRRHTKIQPRFSLSFERQPLQQRARLLEGLLLCRYVKQMCPISPVRRR